MTTIPKPRIESLDLLKGLVIVIMALDHVRDYFHYSAFYFEPTDLTKTSLPIFFTRFITNALARWVPLKKFWVSIAILWACNFPTKDSMLPINFSGFRAFVKDN